MTMTQTHTQTYIEHYNKLINKYYNGLIMKKIHHVTDEVVLHLPTYDNQEDTKLSASTNLSAKQPPSVSTVSAIWTSVHHILTKKKETESCNELTKAHRTFTSTTLTCVVHYKHAPAY